MAEFFKGLAIKAGIMRSDEQEKLDNMIDDYAKGGSRGHRDAAEVIKVAMAASPDLKARTLEAVRDSYLRSYSDVPVDGAGSASYHAHDQSMRIPPQVGRNDTILIDKIFTLGHETEHARSTQGVDYAKGTLLPAIASVAKGGSDGPRDYTSIVNDYAERTRAEEGRAHIGGFNAVASYLFNEDKPRPEHMLRDLYEAFPGRMGDFIAKTSVGIPATYALKDGLTLDKSGLMPYSPGNIEAMKGHYADKAQLGAEHMNYRQESIAFATGVINDIEQQFAGFDLADRSYIIDPVRLQAHPALGLPENGQLQAKGLPEIAHLDFSNLPPLIVSSSTSVPVSSSSSVQLEAQPSDHPLFAQALPLVVEMSRKDTLGDPQELRNLAAALSVAAHDKGMTAIERIVMSDDAKGIIVSQGAGDARQNARVEADAAIKTPEDQSLRGLPAVTVSSLQPQQQAFTSFSGPSDPTPHKQTF